MKLTHTSSAIDMQTVSEAPNPTVLADIYKDWHNIAIWKRHLQSDLDADVNSLIALKPSLQLAMTISPKNALTAIDGALQHYTSIRKLNEDIATLVEIFGDLFELDSVGLRLIVLDHAMCPRFHVDKVPCRLVTTYQGTATQWLPHHLVDRTKLGPGNNGLPDEMSGIYQHPDDIQQLNSGDVALMKGERWLGNEGAGLVHRSPWPKPGEKRLLLTLDFL